MAEISVSNVLAVWASATDGERSEGLGWYQAAHTFARGLSERYHVPFETAAGVLAVISPRLSWSMNMRAADELIRTGDAPILHTNKSKARRMLAGENVDAVLECASCARGDTAKHVCSGQKVRAFYACIVDPAGSDAVCVDRHAFDVAAGRVGDEVSRKALDRVGVYERVAGCYRQAALISDQSVALPVGPHLTPEDVEHVGRTVAGLIEEMS